MKYCPKCNKNCKNNEKFCPTCGTELEEKIELKTCPSCNAENPSTAKFCNECGESFSKTERKCSKCGKVFTDGSKFCNDCGGKVEEVTSKSLKGQIEELINHNNSLKKANENQKNELGNEISKLQVQLEEAKTKISSQENTISQITDEKESLQQKLNSTETEFSKIEAELKKYKDKEEQELLKKQQEEEQKKRLEKEKNKDFVLLDKYETPFYISKYQVTQELYEKVMGENPSYFKGKKLPVENVSWYDATKFCNKLSKKEGLEPCYDSNHNCNFNANGYRLPTKDEWEYAAKGGENYKYSGSDKLNEVGWYDDNSGGRIHPVGQKKPNGYGLYDMSGNVWEWCWDLYDRSSRALCGGSWYYSDIYCAVSYRRSYGPRLCDYCNGFRLVRSSSN